MFFEALKEQICAKILLGNDLELDNVVDELNACVSPRSLERRGERANSNGAEDSDQLMSYLFEFFRFDFLAVVVFEWQVDFIFLHREVVRV